MAKKYEKEGKQVVIYSGDNDLLQAVDDNVTVLRSFDAKKPGSFIDKTWVLTESKFGILPQFLPIYRSLLGDTSDSIPGVYQRLNRDVAKWIAMSISAPDELAWLTPKTDLEKTWLDRIRTPECMSRFETNYKLMKLCEIPVDVLRYTDNISESYDLLAKYKMFSILSYVRSLK